MQRIECRTCVHHTMCSAYCSSFLLLYFISIFHSSCAHICLQMYALDYIPTMLTCPAFYSLHTSLGCDRTGITFACSAGTRGDEKGLIMHRMTKSVPAKRLRSGGLAPSACPIIVPRSSKGVSAQDAEEQVGIGAI